MHDWCKNMFVKNGLIEEIRKSDITEEQAEKNVITLIY
jgi:oligoribonuclease (3'-5' exoribonuclease)